MNYREALKILGLPDPPTPIEAKKSFRQKALRYHPDKNPDNSHAVRQFLLLTEAYNYLIKNFNKWASTKRGPVKEAEKKVTVEDLEDIFDDIFGFTREDRILGLQNPQILDLSLIDLALGARVRVHLEVYEKCSQCGGSGAQKNTLATICTYCFGSGQIKVSVEQTDKFKICPRCEGRGRKVSHPCSHCNGFGRQRRYKRQEVEIPQGLIPGNVYTLHSYDLKTKKKSDLFIRPHIKLHPLFKVEKSDILCEYPVSKQIAEKGGILDIPTLWGWTQLKIPAEAESGQWVVLHGWGLYTSTAKKKKGDLKIRLKVVSHRVMKKRQKSFLKQVADKNRAYGAQKISFWKRLFR